MHFSHLRQAECQSFPKDVFLSAEKEQTSPLAIYGRLSSTLTHIAEHYVIAWCIHVGENKIYMWRYLRFGRCGGTPVAKVRTELDIICGDVMTVFILVALQLIISYRRGDKLLQKLFDGGEEKIDKIYKYLMCLLVFWKKCVILFGIDYLIFLEVIQLNLIDCFISESFYTTFLLFWHAWKIL